MQITVIGSNLELDIIRIFNRDPTLLLSINQIAARLGKAYPYVHQKVTELISSGVLTKVAMGRSHLCSINLDSDTAVALLCLNESLSKKRLEMPASFDKVKRDFKIYTVLQCRKQIVFVLDHIHDKAAISNLYRPKEHKLVFHTRESFQQELLRDKSLLTSKTVVYSSEKYYELLNEIRPQLTERWVLR